MHPSPDSPTAVVLLPPVRGRLGDRTLSRWLSQGRLQEVPAPVDPFTQILGELGQERPPEGLAALRMWGQTGDRPGSWIAGADPVYMEPRLDRLFLHVLGPGDASRSELRRVFDGLQDTLGADDKIGFARLGGYGYIRAAQPMLTPEVPATVLDGQSPGDSLRPMGVAADTLKLISEIEMTLHEMPVNEERRSRGQAPVNSLWIWGGGFAPAQRTVPVPPLYAEDPLLCGYWLSVGGTVAAWPGTISECLDAAPGGFIAEVPADPRDGGELSGDLLALRDALRSGRLGRAILISADGIRAMLKRSDRLRVWRRTSGLLGEMSA
ncbi:MAG: hypothetical protein GWP60_00325 [Gammaproteobacteria bacterium]|nr:hypothetical protein [Gammaproteobacteria bacterium]